MGVIMKIINDILMFTYPQVLRMLIITLTGSQHLWQPIFWSIALFLTCLIQSLLVGAYFCHMYVVGIKVRSLMFALIYRKSLRLSPAARIKYTTGEITNYLSVDCQRFFFGIQFTNMLWAGPLQILAATFFMYELVGISSVIGIFVLLLVVPFKAFLIRYF